MLDSELMEKIQRYCENQCQEFNLTMDGKIFILSDVKITIQTTPVKKPTIRGGVYPADATAYKIIGSTTDFSIVPFLSKKMLGPSTEFSELKLESKVKTNDKFQNVLLTTNLTNFMQNSKKVELHMVIVKADLH